ncbi:MAG: DNA-binding protein [Negativicutes bacterium]|nr:DNA-binding protein [Negativicutes bacterium]
MEDKLQQTETINQLIDCYAGLFTDRQQQMLSMYYSDDYTLAEVAAAFDVSRQAVHDQVQRLVAHLEQYEAVLQLLQRNQAADKLAKEFQLVLDSLTAKLNEDETAALRCLLEKIRLI